MRKSVPSNAAVMLRFTRVVALPDPKIAIFPAESILSYGWVAAYVQKCGADKRASRVKALVVGQQLQMTPMG